MPFDHSRQHETHGPEQASGSEAADPAVPEGTPVVVRRHAGVAALVGAAASTVAIAYLWRASQTMTVLDWSLCAVMAAIAGVYLASLVDARTPLLVADELGVRIRLGDEWRGLPWDAIGQVVVHPRRGLLRDGRLVFAPRSLARALEGLDAKARRHVALNQRLYGAALAVPLGTTTHVSTRGERSVADEIAALALGRADVVQLDPRTSEETDRAAAAEEPGTAPEATSGGEASRQAKDRDEPEAEDHAAAGARTESRAGSPAVGSSGGAAAVAASPGDTDGDSDPASGAEPTSRVVFPSIGAGRRQPRQGTGASEGLPGEILPGESLRGGALPSDEEPPARTPRRSILGGIGTIVSRVAKGRSHDVDSEAALRGAPATPGASDVPASRPAPAAALRDTRPGLRAEATLDTAPTTGSAALDASAAEAARTGLPEGRELHRPGSVDLVFEKVELDERVRPISTLGDPVEPLVIDDYVTEPAYDPVIGPELTAARTRLGLSVDELAERTRIRPHVIESIEVDDFAPCGGDFYARGHLRTLARILGKDAAPMIERFEERYATAPINARRVFEAELATGMTGSMRSTVGGPSWGLLVGAVLCLVLIWGVLRLFAAETADLPAPVVNGSAAVHGAPPLDSGAGLK